MPSTKPRSDYQKEYYQRVTRPKRRRNGETGECCYCGHSGLLTVEHVIPKSKGGSGGETRKACAWCNLSRGNRDLGEWRSSLARRIAGVPDFTRQQRAWLRDTAGLDVYAVDVSDVVFAFESGGGATDWRRKLP